jgi:hypothetical protein
MSFVSRFRRRPAEEEATPEVEAILVIDQHVLSYRSPDWYGHANYHVRVFRPEGFPRPVVLIGDLDNHPVASIVERCPEVMAIVANRVLGGQPARWLFYQPADGALGERFGEAQNDRLYDIRRDDAQGLAGGPLASWQRRDYTVTALEQRGIRVIAVHPGDVPGFPR